MFESVDKGTTVDNRVMVGSYVVMRVANELHSHRHNAEVIARLSRAEPGESLDAPAPLPGRTP